MGRRVLALLTVLAASPALATDELPPLVVHGSPLDLLSEDPVLAPHGGAVDATTAEGSALGVMERHLPLGFSDYGGPGALSQVQGFNRSASETAVEAMGVPLQLPQGVGFDFSSFPSFLWDSYEYQPGLGSLAADPRATGAVVTLNPWTEARLEKGEIALEARQLISSDDLSQSSVGVSDGKAWAALAGMSAGHARGPSGALAFRHSWGQDALTAQLLATGITSDSPGPDDFPTPRATNQVTRWTPVLRWDRASSGQALKVSAYVDDADSLYDNPDTTPSEFRVHTTQEGLQGGWTDGTWRLGTHLRRISYRTDSFTAPDEWQLMAHAGRTALWGPWTLDAALEAGAVSRFGVEPAGSVGVRWMPPEVPGWALVLRGRGTRRVPTLSDRYFDDAFFDPNPALKPERVAAGWLGVEATQGALRPSISVQVQSYEDAWNTVPSGGSAVTVINAGNALGTT
ncbi:MAG TPA: hypothetical protein VL588_11975, partial [Bdellovibrionota bacterium]|nr:hypothetical protein [Bdellovibrionota bacterium]